MAWITDTPAAGGTGGETGDVVHSATTGRSNANQHPIAAISQLTEELSKIKLPVDVTVTGVDVGGLAAGTVVPAGTTAADILQSILVKRVAATYTAPTLSLSSSGTKLVESGTLLNATHTPTWTKNDAGNPTLYRLLRNGTQVYSGGAVVAQAHNHGALVDASAAYTCEATYAAGPVKYDNLGDLSPVGQIVAGTITSNTVTFRGARKAFFGVSTEYADSAAIRALSGSLLDPVAGSELNLIGQTGTTLVFAYPATLRNPTAVQMTSGGFGFSILAELVQQADMQVEALNGGNDIAYKVFTFTAAAQFNNASFKVTI